MINKTLHYIWVGGKEFPTTVMNNIENAKKVLGKDWKVKIWTEKDFDINSNEFTKYWYEKKQWAFVSDYIRAWAVHKEGGFYFDTDINLLKDISHLTKYDYVASRTYVVENTMSIFGAKKGHEILKIYMDTISYPKMIKQPPKLMSTHIHTYAIRKIVNVSIENEDFIEGNIAILKENKLQIKTNDEAIAIHEHHDNWKGNKGDELIVSKYYKQKVEAYNNITPAKIAKWEKFISKKLNKIEKLTK